ncbi:TPA: hypothetical protein N0F65_002325 [Lagenidium giganteum]|uniref:DDE Tnp4 domain-containing protein n=1 Tax=Lagenidium giganteum TaxID=4803 RepID=A0AAV2Z989_9STRA|nr:TPA: hypothetical protein N0F65_002325 [Lagenidium giganteum]
MQAVVDDHQRFMPFSICSGQNNDKSVFNLSQFGQHCHRMIRRRHYFVADAGYQLYCHVITQYTIEASIPKDEAKFNKVHSSTRIVVEMAFGRFKNVFRIFKSALLHESATEMSLVIQTAILLHNLMIDARERSDVCRSRIGCTLEETARVCQVALVAKMQLLIAMH